MKSSLDTFEKTLSITLFLCSLVSCVIGLITSCISSSTSSINTLLGIFASSLLLVVIIILSIVFIFVLKNYIYYNFIIAIFMSFIMFPILFILSGNISSGFIFYLFIPPAVFGLIIRKPWQVFIPFLLMVFYLDIFYMAASGILLKGLVTEALPLTTILKLSLDFISAYLFITLFTYNATKFTLASRTKYIELASKDSLTGFYNRRSLGNDLEACPYKFGIMIDIDNFKKINDTYGHQAGDEVLRNLAEIIQKYCTNEFKPYRYGGEEFFIISRFKAKDTFERLALIYKDVHDNLSILNNKITISCGISENWDTLPDDFISEADTQLYLAKHNGKNGAYFMNLKLSI